jgi:hypothetical protein
LALQPFGCDAPSGFISSPTTQFGSFTPSAETQKIEEYAVYSAVMRKMFVADGVKLLVIQNRTLFSEEHLR